MSTKNFVSYGDAETLFTGIGNKLSSLKSGLTTLDNEVNGDATTYPYADVITIPDAVPSNLADCSVKIEPVQDLHGYDHPWVGGAEKNKLPMTVDGIKAENTTGTWSGNVYTLNDMAVTILTDDDGNVTGIKANGTANADAEFSVIRNYTVIEGQILNGNPSGLPTGCGYGIGGVGIVLENYETQHSFTASEAGANKHLYIKIANGSSLSNLIFLPMVRLSTETDATFAPYTNICPITGHTEASVEVTDGDETTQTYTIALGDTIYGGTVDFDSGVMTVTHALVTKDFTGTSDASFNYQNITYGFINKLTNSADYQDRTIKAITTMFETDTSSGSWDSANKIGKMFGTADMGQYWVGFEKNTTLEQMNTLISNALPICYELATPTTIQLTPQQIQLLKGQNTLTASTGQISVTVNGVSGSIGAVQEQVNELAEDVALKQNATDNNLQTTDKTIVGGINELKSGLIDINSNLTNKRCVQVTVSIEALSANSSGMVSISNVSELPDVVTIRDNAGGVPLFAYNYWISSGSLIVQLYNASSSNRAQNNAVFNLLYL